MLKDGLAIKLQLCNVHRGNNWNTVGAGSSRSWCDQLTVFRSDSVVKDLSSSFVNKMTLTENSVCEQKSSFHFWALSGFTGLNVTIVQTELRDVRLMSMSWIKPGLIDGHEAAGRSETERGDDHVTEHELSLSRSLALKWLCFYI